MKQIMQEKAALEEQVAEQNNIRNSVSERLIEKWSKKKGLDLDNGGFAKIYEASPRKARNLALALENQERHLKNLTETQISNAFLATPQTVVKVIRLGYPNSVRGEIFTDWTMQTMKDTMFKVETTYDRTKRGATLGNVTYESTADRYASEMEEVTVSGTGTGSYSGTFAVKPLRPYTLNVYLNGFPIGNDNGAGVITGTGITSGTIDYTTGAYTIVFASSLTAADAFKMRYAHDSEVSSLYGEQGQFNIQIVGYDYRARPFPLGFSWSKMTEYIMNDALKTDAEEILITAASDELKKSLDFQALKMGYAASQWTTAVEFNTNWAAAGADSDYAHTQSVTKYLRTAAQKTYAALMRGGEATSYVAGPGACTYLTQHKGFTYDKAMATVGAYKMGELGGIPVYQVPTDIVPNDEIMCVYKNNREESNDSALVAATFVPLYRTQTLEYSSFHKESAIANFGDLKIQEGRYITRVKLLGL